MKSKLLLVLLTVLLIMTINTFGCSNAQTNSDQIISVSNLLRMKNGTYQAFNLTPGSTISTIEKKLGEVESRKISKKGQQTKGIFTFKKHEGIKVTAYSKSLNVNYRNLIVSNIEILAQKKSLQESAVNNTLSQPLGEQIKGSKKRAVYSKFLTVTYIKQDKRWIVERISYHKADRIIISIRIDYSIDVNNPREVIKDADYVFVARVIKKNKTHYDNEMTNSDGSKWGEPYTNYEVKNLTNIKGKLPLNQKIQIDKFGGIRKDQSAYDIPEGDIIPDINMSYIFIAYQQPDGKLLVSGAHSTIKLEQKYGKASDLKKIKQSKVYQTYNKASRL